MQKKVPNKKHRVTHTYLQSCFLWAKQSAQRQIKNAYKLGEYAEGLSQKELSWLCITYLHSDLCVCVCVFLIIDKFLHDLRHSWHAHDSLSLWVILITANFFLQVFVSHRKDIISFSSSYGTACFLLWDSCHAFCVNLVAKVYWENCMQPQSSLTFSGAWRQELERYDLQK